MTKLTSSEISQAFADPETARRFPPLLTEAEAAVPSEFLTRREFIARTGISASTLERYRRDGLVPFCQPRGKGGKVFIPVSALSCLSEPAIAQKAPMTAIPATGARQSGPKPRWQQNSNQKVKL